MPYGKKDMIELIQTSELRTGACSFMSHHHLQRVERVIPDFDLLYTIAGSYELIINGTSYSSRRGELFILPPGSLLEIHAREDSFQFFCHFSLETRGQGCLDGRFSDFRLPGASPGLLSAFDQYIQKSLQERSPLPSYLPLILKLLLIGLIEHSEGNLLLISGRAPAGMPDVISATLDYIHQNLDHELTLSHLAEKAGFHPSYFARYFKRHMGLTPASYICQYRMEYARYLICSTSKGMKEIAAILGFPDQFTFSRRFRSYYHMPPTAMRSLPPQVPPAGGRSAARSNPRPMTAGTQLVSESPSC